MGIAVRFHRHGLFAVWQKAKGGGAATVRAGADVLSLLRYQYHRVGGNWRSADRAAVFPQNLKNLTCTQACSASLLQWHRKYGESGLLPLWLQ